MYSFLVTARIKGASEYDWFRYNSRKPLEVSFRGKPIEVTRGTIFGVRPSSNKKSIRLVFPNEITKVITIDLPTAQALAIGVTAVDAP